MLGMQTVTQYRFQGRALVTGQRTSTLVLLVVALVAVATLLGTLVVEGAFVPPPPASQALPGDTEWSNEEARIHDAAAKYLAATKAARQAEADDQLIKWGNYCAVADGLPTPVSDGATASAKYVQDACAALEIAPNP
jgi:hypothetical protein